MRLNLLFFFVFLPFGLAAQRMPGDSILMHERSIDRPITLHAKQVRVTGGYDLSILSRRFDQTGEVINMRDEGSSSVRNDYSLDVKYGVTDHVQLTAAIAATRQVISRETEYLTPRVDPGAAHDVQNSYSGMRDLFLGVDVRAPLRTRKFDVAVSLGAYIPTAPSGSQKPRHTFRAVTQDGSPLHQYSYHYHDAPGYGIVVGIIGATIKYRTSLWAFSSGVDYRHGTETGSGYAWKHQITSGGEFEYRKEKRTYRLPDAFNYFAEIELQASRRLNLFVNGSGVTAYDGWVSNADDLKVAVPYRTIILISPGVEILLTPKLWLRERLDLSLAGKNHEAVVALQTSIMYNFFAINRD